MYDTSNYELNRSFPKRKNRKVIGLMKNKLGGKIRRQIVRLRAKTYTYLIDNGSEDKKLKDTKKVCDKNKA